MKHYGSRARGSSAIQERLTGWLILTVMRREEGRGRRGERDEGLEGDGS